MSAGKGTAPSAEQLREKQRDSCACRRRRDAEENRQETSRGGWGAETGSEASFKSFSWFVSFTAVGEPCKKQTPRCRARHTRGGFGSEVNCLSVLSWPITSGGPVCTAQCGQLFLLKAFKLIYFCLYPNWRIKQCSYLFSCCSGHRQSYPKPLRSENSALLTSQTNHKNLINALSYFQPLTWNPAHSSSCWSTYEMQTCTPAARLRWGAPDPYWSMWLTTHTGAILFAYGKLIQLIKWINWFNWFY